MPQTIIEKAPASTPKSRQLTPPMKSTSSTYRTSPVKQRRRRTKAEMMEVLTAVKTILAGEENQISIRHLFYRLAALKVIPKTEPAYKNLCGHLSKWRRGGDIRWASFVDSTRWYYSRKTFGGVRDALSNTVENYRRNLWATQPFYVEVWVEKETVAGIVSDTANAFGVPVFVARGFASLSSLYDAANTFREATKNGKQVVVYHLGDYDPSGVAAGDSIIRTFRDDFEVDLQFTRLAVTPEQIKRLNLPTRPVKASRHSKSWTGGDSVELDSMPPAEIRRIVEAAITQHIDEREWQLLKTTEAEERETLKQILRRAA